MDSGGFYFYAKLVSLGLSQGIANSPDMGQVIAQHTMVTTRPRFSP